MLIEPADHPLTDAEISERYGGIISAGVQAFRDDMMYLVDVAEDWARVQRPEPRANHSPLTAMERKAQADLTREVKAQQDVILRERFEQGISGSVVAKELRVVEATILLRWRQMGLHASSRARTQVKRLKTPEQAERERVVREHAEAGRLQRETAEELGISTQSVYLIRKRLGIS